MTSEAPKPSLKRLADRARGTLKKAVGEIVGDAALYAEGEADRRPAANAAEPESEETRRRGRAQRRS
ncbi:MAG TPA: hypothetical protein VNR11_08510 [Xanthobacteraceae bacterium]|nr:hypothetical protein [Xanthobacteraceae bacterium]